MIAANGAEIILISLGGLSLPTLQIPNPYTLMLQLAHSRSPLYTLAPKVHIIDRLRALKICLLGNCTLLARRRCQVIFVDSGPLELHLISCTVAHDHFKHCFKNPCVYTCINIHIYIYVEICTQNVHLHLHVYACACVYTHLRTCLTDIRTST